MRGSLIAAAITIEVIPPPQLLHAAARHQSKRRNVKLKGLKEESRSSPCSFALVRPCHDVMVTSPVITGGGGKLTSSSPISLNQVLPTN